VTGLIYGLVV